MGRGVRGLAFVAAGLAHIVLIALFATPARQRESEPIEARRMVLVFLEPEARRLTSEPLQPAVPLLHLPQPDVTIELPQVDSSAGITTLPDTPPQETPPSVDWQQETRSAAARMAETLESERRRKGKLAPDPRFARPAPRPQFGWDESKIHRIEALPEGGTIIHLNDRCVLALTGFLIPMCKLGKIPARGDLFEHMADSRATDDLP